MANSVEDGRRALPSELAHALGGYKATAELWRSANNLVRARQPFDQPRSNGCVWPRVFGNVETDTGRVATRLHVFVDDTPPIFTGEYIARLDCLGSFGVRMNVIHEDGRGYRLRQFGGRWAASNSLCQENSILQDPDKIYDSTQRASVSCLDR